VLDVPAEVALHGEVDRTAATAYYDDGTGRGPPSIGRDHPEGRRAMTDGKVIVGYDGSERSKDAFVLGSRLADVLRARVVLADVYTLVPLGGEAAGIYQYIARQDAERVLNQAEAADAVERRAIPSHSAARGLHSLAEEEGAILIVVGSSHRGIPGRTEPGGVAQRLLHGAPCAVAVAPVGYAETAARPWRRILVGYIDTDEGAAALRAAVALARATGAVLRVVTVVAPVPSAFATADAKEYLQVVKDERRQALEKALAKAARGLAVEAEVLDGEPSDVLRERAADVDLVVVGSRGYGRLRQVLLGSVSAKLLHGVPAPVIVLPRGAERELAAVLTGARSIAATRFA
jgi:nucleotide-binding universal stress UspA family protein